VPYYGIGKMMSKEIAKTVIKGLVDKYNKVVQERRLSKYTEEETKKDFILPLFRALSWNVEDSREVTAEETISKKRVDYGFRINGIPKFFLEAKALKADLDNPQFVEQAINYAWHKSCTWAVLTDFQCVKIFNAEWKTTDIIQSTFFSLDCHQFLERFDQLWLLSRESFEHDLLDTEAEKWGKKSKKSPVGEQLLTDLTKWRAELYKDIIARNKDKNLNEEELDEAVQRIIDRLIFIRNCEDRELEPRTLLSIMRDWGEKPQGALFEHVTGVFRHFDAEYNSKLFEHHLCDDLDINNRVLEGIIKDLYHTKDRTIKYDFSVLDADVLGNVYEQYLGHILKKTAKQAVLKEKHAYRKEQGIYYTPTYIVDYIVRNTLGELLKNKKVDVEKIRVLDPACGSGSFLIKTFDILNEFYTQTAKDYSQTRLDLESGLPFTQKVKILHNNIFSVDLDARAVEIAQLNLLLKIAEKRQRLPLLQQNIKCGNSLIDDEKVAGDKAFKWEMEFSENMKEGGFDVVIGNPPYIRTHLLPRKEKQYYDNNFECAFKQYDIYALFIERGIDLLKDGGRLGFIVSNKFATSDYGLKLREKILNECAIESIVDVSSLPVFKDASIYPYIIILRKEPRKEERKKTMIKVITELGSENEFISRKYQINEIPQKRYLNNPNFIFDILPSKVYKIIDRIERDTILLEKITTITRGFRPPPRNLVITKHEYEILPSDKKSLYRKFIIGNELTERYRMNWSRKYLKYEKDEIKESKPPEVFEQPKIMMRDISLKPEAYFDDEFFYCLKTIYMILRKDENYDLRYLTGILNSKAMDFYFRSRFWASHISGGYLRFRKQFLEQLPIPIVDFSNPKKKTLHNKIVELVNKILSLNKRLNEIGDKKTDQSHKIEEDIKKTDAEINELVYQLYGITEEEKKVIEESLK
jgi:predicted metallopeptidase